jgi:hypothetical protein
MQRNAQVTVFIILGLILLFGAAFLFYVQFRQTSSATEQAKVPIIKEVPYEFQPVNSHVQSCISQIAVDGLRKMGMQGGYIDPLKYGLRLSSGNPTEADLVEFMPGSSTLVPYWYYLKSDNDCVGVCEFSYSRPYLYRLDGAPSIEGQLDDYIGDNLQDCVSNDALLRQRGFVIQPDAQVKATTSIFEKDIGVLIDYPVKVTKGTSTHNIEQFFLRIPLDLRSIYEQATVITNLQQKYKFLEKDLLNLIVGYSGVSEKKLPPIAATDFEFGSGKVWVKSKVKTIVQELLVRDISALQVYGSRNFRPVVITGNAFREGLYNDGMRVHSLDTFPNLNVEFNYLDSWPIYFDLNCDGETCKAESASSNLIGLIGVQRYNFLYDVSFPVIVAIIDPGALNSQGYQFQFFLEANIRDNEPMNTTYVPLVSAAGSESSMLCDADKKNSGEITIRTVNSLNSAPVSDVEVTFTCGDESCSMGKSQDGVLSSSFPVCLGGVVSFFKDGFVSNSLSLSTELGVSQKIDSQLIPLKTMLLVVQKYNLVKSDGRWILRDNPVQVNSDEWGTLNLLRVSGLGEEEYSAVSQFNSSVSSIALAPGDYVLDASLMLEKQVVILPQRRCEDTLLSEKCYDVPPEKLELDSPVPVGGIYANFTVTKGDLEKSRLVVNVIGVDIASIPESQRVIEDLDPMAKIKDYSNSHKTILKPRFE